MFQFILHFTVAFLLGHILVVPIFWFLEIEVIMKNAVFWDVALSRHCVNRHFGGTYRLHLLILWRWKQCVPPKRQFAQDLHGARSQKTTFFIVTAVGTSNLTEIIMFLIRFDVITAEVLRLSKIKVFCDVTPCNLVAGTWCYHHCCRSTEAWMVQITPKSC
jgi:hypothetical protein